MVSAIPVAESRGEHSVFIIAEQPICRYGLAHLIENTGGFFVCGEAGSPTEAREELRAIDPEVVLLDMSLHSTNSIEFVKQLHQEHSKAAIVAISNREEAVYVPRVLRAGAQGYLLKREGLNRFQEALEKVTTGRVYVSPTFSDQILTRLAKGSASPAEAALDRLSNREMEVLHLLGTAKTTRQIAQQLHLSIKTVESHRARLKEKLGLRNAVELIRFAVEWVRQQGE